MKKKLESVKLQEITTRENLVSFYNELNEVMGKSFAHLKRRPSKARIKKVCKPILDKWEERFDGKVIHYTAEIKLAGERNKKQWKNYKEIK